MPGVAGSTLHHRDERRGSPVNGAIRVWMFSTMKTPPARGWYAVSAEDAFEALGSTAAGLTADEVEERRRRFGANELPEGKRLTLFGAFIRQFRDPLIYILLAAAAVSLAMAHFNDAIFIGIVLLLNAAIGTAQEQKAEESARALQKMVRISTTVLRDGEEHAIDSSELVPGDLVLLSSGDAVPADIRLTASDGLRIDESLLTGESLPVEKDARGALPEETPLGDRKNMAFTGTLVAEGRGRGVVSATGAQTQVGTIAVSLASGAGEEPPLVIRMKRMSRVISVAMLVAIAIIAAVSLTRGEPLAQVFFIAVALAVAAIPEGLPVAITVALSIASRRMAARRVIVRRLPAVEGLGACTLIASDKTGTLTANELTVTKLVLPGEGEIEVREEMSAQSERLARIARVAALCNEARLHVEGDTIEGEGDAVDVAFLVLAAMMGVRREELLRESPRAGAIPYEPQLRMAASFHEENGERVVYVKGATEAVLPLCGDCDADRVRADEEALAGEGYRVIALAAGAAGPTDRIEDLHDLDFLGLAGLIDPIRPEVPDAVRRCREAGVEVRMITGDHPATGRAIAKELGIAGDDAIVTTGADLARFGDSDEAELDRRVEAAPVFARVEPRQKTTIVSALQRHGHFVAVTGDGVNDAPALRAAHIGIAMGASGTDVARTAADLILTDDNFASIVNGIEEGRVAYDNVRKVTLLVVTTGLAEIVLLFFSIAFNLPLPLTAVQLLWLNLVTNGIQDVALAFEKGERDVLKRKPRPPSEGIFDRRMIEQVAILGFWMGAVAFVVFALLLRAGVPEEVARMELLLLMVLFENVHVFNSRSETRSAFRVPLSNNWPVVASVVVAQSLHVGAAWIPGLNSVLEIAPLSLSTWLQLLPIALSIIVVGEIIKLVRRMRRQE